MWLLSESPTAPKLSFALVDEPEAALHPAAERQVAQGLKSLADFVVVATHSLQTIDNADHILHVTRGDNGDVQLSRLSVDLTPARRQLEACRLGMTPGSLAALVRVVLVVEGAMDVSVISSFLAPEIEQAGVLLLPLHGTTELTAIPSADYLFHSTDAPVVVCLDNTDAKQVRNLLTQLRKFTDKGRRRHLLQETRSDHSFRRSSEMRKFVDLLDAACEAERLDRIEVFGFRKADIVQYLPVTLIRPDADSWEDLWTDFRALPDTRVGPGAGKQFKSFVGKGYTVKGVEHALDRMRLDLAAGRTLSDVRPVEFTRLAMLLAELARR